MIVYRRVVRLEEIDAANIVFFARYASYMHEALEHMLPDYPKYIAADCCFATVKLAIDYHAPLRYGDEFRVEVRVTRLGNRSCTLEYRVIKPDNTPCTTLVQTAVVTRMSTTTSCDMPDPVRAILTAHLV